MSDIQWLDAPVVDAEVVAPHGTPCAACATPVEPLDRFCPACGTANPGYRQQAAGTLGVPSHSPGVHAGPQPGAGLEAGAKQASPLSKHFQCRNCGAEVATEPNYRSYVCPFCDSTYVIELPPDQTGRQLPEFVIGFAISPEQAQEAFKRWLKDNRWFRPGDLATASIIDKMKGIYLPFWSFAMLAESRWRARIGEYWYRTETYTTTDSKGRIVTKTRQVRETEWWPLAGKHHRYYSGYLVSGSKGLPQDQALRIQPFNLPALRRYEPYFLAGWLAEDYSVAREAALRLCQEEFLRQENANVAAFLPGDTHQELAVETQFGHVSSDLCLLPVYILSYRYNDQLFRFLLNGQTGKMAGDKPISKQRIAVAVAIVLAAILLLVLIGVVVANLR